MIYDGSEEAKNNSKNDYPIHGQAITAMKMTFSSLRLTLVGRSLLEKSSRADVLGRGRTLLLQHWTQEAVWKFFEVVSNYRVQHS